MKTIVHFLASSEYEKTACWCVDILTKVTEKFVMQYIMQGRCHFVQCYQLVTLVVLFMSAAS